MKTTYNKFFQIVLNALPIIVMIGLIPVIQNDYILSLMDLFIIAISFLVRYEKKDYVFLVLGFLIMMVSEYFFVLTGVEIFVRKTLFGLMPLWLPVLWAYAFVAMKRTIIILDATKKL